MKKIQYGLLIGIIGLNEEENAFYGFRITYASYVSTHRVFSTTGSSETFSSALHPIIVLSSGLLDISNRLNNGAASSTAWNIK